MRTGPFLKIIVISMLLIGAVFNLYADDGSARCYGLIITNSTSCKVFLLGRNKVQKSLKLSPSQRQLLVSGIQGTPPPDQMPGYAAFAALKEKKLKAAKSEEERSAIDKKEDETFENHFLESVIQKSLSKSQTNQLEQLLRQMKGPGIILEDTNLIAQLGLSADQIQTFKETSEENSTLISLLRKRSGDLQMNGVTRRRDKSDKVSELICLNRVFKEVEKDDDDGYMNTLNGEQKALWKKLCGKPLNLEWKPDDIWHFDDK